MKPMWTIPLLEELRPRLHAIAAAASTDAGARVAYVRAVDAIMSANRTCVGICAHESATKGGEIVRLPDFTLAT